MRPFEHQLANILQVLKTAVTMLPAEQSRDGKLDRLDQIVEAAERCEHAMNRLDAEEELRRGSRLLI